MSTPEQPCPLIEQAVAWALHSLEPDEEMAVLLHLPQCPSCRFAVHDAESVLANLGAAVEQMDPPPSLRGAILAAAADTPQRVPMLHPRTSQENVPAESAPRHRAHGEPAPVRPPTRVPSGRMSRSSWLSGRGRRLVAASLALVGVLAVGGLAARNSQLEQQRDAETTQAQTIADLIPELGRPGVTHAILADGANSTVAVVVVTNGEPQLLTVGLPSNATDRDIYVLWGIKGGVPQPLGTFDVAAADPGLRTVGSGADADDFSTYAISIEPGRVAPAVPTQVVAKGDVAV